MRKCPICGSDCADSHKFCLSCGASLKPSQSPLEPPEAKLRAASTVKLEMVDSLSAEPSLAVSVPQKDIASEPAATVQARKLDLSKGALGAGPVGASDSSTQGDVQASGGGVDKSRVTSKLPLLSKPELDKPAPFSEAVVGSTNSQSMVRDCNTGELRRKVDSMLNSWDNAESEAAHPAFGQPAPLLVATPESRKSGAAEAGPPPNRHKLAQLGGEGESGIGRVAPSVPSDGRPSQKALNGKSSAGPSNEEGQRSRAVNDPVPVGGSDSSKKSWSPYLVGGCGGFCFGVIVCVVLLIALGVVASIYD